MILKPIIAHFSDPNKLLYNFFSEPLIDQIKCDMYFIELCLTHFFREFFFHSRVFAVHSEMVSHISSLNKNFSS